MHTFAKNWLSILLVLLFSLVLILGFFLYGTATNYAEAISVCLIFSIFLLLVLLIPLEAFISDLVGRIIHHIFSDLRDILLDRLDRGHNALYKFGVIFRFALFILGAAVILHGLIVTFIDKLLPCQPLLPELVDTPLDTKVLAKCPFTEPLTEIISGDLRDVSANANNFAPVLLEYVGLFMDNLYFGIAIAFASGLPRQLWSRLAIAMLTSIE